MSEAEDAGFEVAVVQATDSDEGINSAIVYSITPGNGVDDQLFTINPLTGRITLSRSLGKLFRFYCSI